MARLRGVGAMRAGVAPFLARTWKGLLWTRRRASHGQCRLSDRSAQWRWDRPYNHDMDRCLEFAAAGQVNHNDGSIDPLPNSIDVCNIAFVAIDSGLLSPGNLNRLLSVSPTNPYAASGQYLAALENVRSLWVPRLPVIRYESVFLRTKNFSLGKSSLRIVPSIAYSFDQAAEIINRACGERPQVSDFLNSDFLNVESLVYSAVEVTESLLRKLDRRILLVRRLVHRSLARFCAFSWSRRLWYLLHGSHPPKTECRPAFGCA
jgi:hypothetical protein